MLISQGEQWTRVESSSCRIMDVFTFHFILDFFCVCRFSSSFVEINSFSFKCLCAVQHHLVLMKLEIFASAKSEWSPCCLTRYDTKFHFWVAKYFIRHFIFISLCSQVVSGFVNQKKNNNKKMKNSNGTISIINDEKDSFIINVYMENIFKIESISNCLMCRLTARSIIINVKKINTFCIEHQWDYEK